MANQPPGKRSVERHCAKREAFAADDRHMQRGLVRAFGIRRDNEIRRLDDMTNLVGDEIGHV
ncbi:MAG: hypothetical protein M3176_15460, partial [Chloroflexota bacterium]|nr:hypothetical protein [Chloroflexota bacterium]